MYVPALIVGVVKISEALPSSVLEANGNHHCGTARCRNKSGSLSSRAGGTEERMWVAPPIALNIFSVSSKAIAPSAAIRG